VQGKIRSDIKEGSRVNIVLKQNQKSAQLTEGIVEKILTSSHSHPHGIKVKLKSGDIGRVKEIL